jgi:hypothetical protein
VVYDFWKTPEICLPSTRRRYNPRRASAPHSIPRRGADAAVDGDDVVRDARIVLLQGLRRLPAPQARRLRESLHD